ncbi:GTPase family protein, partial [Escherichia coli]
MMLVTSATGTERTVRLDSDLYQPHIPAFQIISDRYYRCESPATFPVRGVLSFFTGNTCM